MSSRKWLTGYCLIVTIPLILIAVWVIKTDPYFHFHKPDTSNYYYTLNKERFQNDGILRNFEYDGIITGTSMAENFKTSDAELFFGGTFVKVPYEGAYFQEIDRELRVALKHNRDLKIIIRGLDMNRFRADKDQTKKTVYDFPEYLYNDNPFDDVEYLFNRNVVFEDCYEMTSDRLSDGFTPGITSFDDYRNWMKNYNFGYESVLGEGTQETDFKRAQPDLSEKEKENVRANVRQNITDLAREYPDVDFYIFFTPYSVVWWQKQINDGNFNKQIQAERIVIEEMLQVSNIKLYSFNNLTDITTDLNNYKDDIHYGDWINSLMLSYMSSGTCLLSEDNYQDYLKSEEEFYGSLNYDRCYLYQKDYRKDYLAAAVLNEEIYGVEPYIVSEPKPEGNKYVLTIDDVSAYKYIVCKEAVSEGTNTISIYDGSGTLLFEESRIEQSGFAGSQHIIDIERFEGQMEIVFTGEYIESSLTGEKRFVYSEIAVY